MKTNPNDSAFAHTAKVQSISIPSEILDVNHHGLTKREYFAAMAMQGILSNKGLIDTDNWKWVAESSAYMADALIEQLNKQP